LNMWHLHCFETLGTGHPVMQYRIPKKTKPRLQCFSLVPCFQLSDSPSVLFKLHNWDCCMLLQNTRSSKPMLTWCLMWVIAFTF